MFKLKFYYSILIIISSTIYGQLLMKTYYEINDDCIRNLIRHIFKREQTVTYIYNDDTSNKTKKYDEDDVILLTILNEYPSIITNLNDDYRGHIINYGSNYVIYTRDLNNLKIVVRKFRSHKYWMDKVTPKKMFIIFVENLKRNEAEDVFYHLKEYHYIVNVLLININLDKYNFTIYKLLNICNKIEMESYVTNCKERHLKINDYYYGKNLLRGCNFTGETTSVFLESNLLDTQTEQTGVLIKPFELITEYYGIEFQYVSCSRDAQEKYVLLDTPVKKFYCGHFVIASLYRGTITFKDFDSSNIIFYDSYIWLLRKPKRLSNSEIIISIYDKKTWLSIISTFLLNWLFLWLVGKLKRITRLNLGNSLMYILQLSLLLSIKFIAKSSIIRFFLIVFLIYAYHIIYLFQGHLSSLLTKPLLEKSIETTQDLIDADIEPVLPNGIRKIMTLSDKKIANLIANKSNIIFSYNTSTFDFLLSATTRIAVITRSLRQTGNRYNLVDKFEDDLVNKPELNYVFENGSYLLSYVNNIIRISVENGFVHKWHKDKLNFHKRQEKLDIKIVLTLKHLQMAFRCLNAGFLLSIFVFCIELIYYHFLSKRPRPAIRLI